MAQLRVRRFVAEREELLLRAVERERDVSRLVVGVRGDRRGRSEEAPQDRAVPNDAAVPVDLGRGRDPFGERAKIGLAAGAVSSSRRASSIWIVSWSIRSRRSSSACAAE